jgi:CubicO group peptidase (beta-lactamase class C family)
MLPIVFEASHEEKQMNKVRFAVAVLAAALVAPLLPTAPASAATSCDTSGTWQRRSPHQLDMSSTRLREALTWATAHGSTTIAVYRHGCLADQSRLDTVTSQSAFDGWSMTKTVTALAVGRAVTLGRLDIDRPIGRLYPEADAAHARLTPRQLLTMTSGLHRNWVRELSPQANRVRDALSLPFDHRPGTKWEYAQSAVSLLANVVERAVGQDVQDFAHAELFGRVGIPRDAWNWDRDREGNTEGWAHLQMRNGAWAKLGQLLMQRGRWQGRQLISRSYIRQMTSPGRTNNAYGFLVWLNRGGSYVLPNVEGPDEGRGQIIPAGPRDMMLMAGSGEQRTYMIPSRDLVIVRLGERGSREGDTRASVWTGRGGQLDHEIVRRVLRAVRDVPYDDPGRYSGSDPYLPPLDDGIVGDAPRDPEHAVAGVGAGPRAPQGCDPTGCQ